MRMLPKVLTMALLAALTLAAAPAWAQARYDDHEITDRFVISLGGFRQNDIRTTLRLDAKTPGVGIGIGAVIGLESLFDVDNEVTTWRLDGWYRFNKKSRINWTYWKTNRDGRATYNQDDPIEIGKIEINPGDFIHTEDHSRLFAASYSYSLVNVSKYEAWIGGGLNFQSIDTSIEVNVGGGSNTLNEEVKATVPIPTFNIGGRWDFNKRVRMFFISEFFGLKIDNYEGKRNNTRILAEWNIVKNFAIGGGFERYSLEVDAEAEDFHGSFDSSYTGLSLYVKGSF